MARYHITALNYMTVGTRRAFFNIDTKLAYDVPNSIKVLSNELREENSIGDIREESEYTKLSTEFIQIEHPPHSPVADVGGPQEGVILAERQDTIETLDPDKGRRIRLYGSKDTERRLREIDEFAARSVSLGNTYVAELGDHANAFMNEVTLTGPDGVPTTIVPMYDIRDVTVKSSVNLGTQNTSIDAEDGYQNVYAPDMEKSPVGFCGVQNGSGVDTYMETTPTYRDPYMYSSDLMTRRTQSQNAAFADYQLKSDRTSVRVYGTPQQLSGVQTYSEFLKAGGDPLCVFVPYVNLRDVKTSYILSFPNSDISTDYRRGNVHAKIRHTKSALGPKYEMEMDGQTTLKRARRYCGIASSSNRVYLKFYDSMTYTGEASGSDAYVNASESSLLPYQKVEQFQETLFTNRRKHKSTLFSIRLRDVGDLSEDVSDSDGSSRDEAVKRIRDDLRSGIRKIVENVCPVNTQLFKVYFGGV